MDKSMQNRHFVAAGDVADSLTLITEKVVNNLNCSTHSRLLLVLLAHPARSTKAPWQMTRVSNDNMIQLKRYINYLLTYLLTSLLKGYYCFEL